MSPRPTDSWHYVHTLRKECMLGVDVRHNRARYNSLHQAMHCLMKCIFDVSKDPAQFVGTVFSVEVVENGVRREFMQVRTEDLEREKEFIGLQMRRVQEKSRVVNVKRMEVLEERKKLLYGDT